MESVLPFIAVVLLVLACPFAMLAIGGIAWLFARARGERNKLSMGCMSGHGQSHDAAGAELEAAALQEQVSRLRQEVAALGAQSATEQRFTAGAGS